jgi:hypothetical protein
VCTDYLFGAIDHMETLEDLMYSSVNCKAAGLAKQAVQYTELLGFWTFSVQCWPQ